MKIRLSAVLQLFDGYKRRPIRPEEVSFLLDQIPARPVYKKNGYFVFSNLSTGTAKIEILSPRFLPETLEIDVSEETGRYGVIYRVLSPDKTYPFNGAPAVLRGKIVSGGKPEAHRRVLFYTLEHQELLKVSQDDLKAGDRAIRLFSGQQSQRLPLPGKFMIADKDENKREICSIAAAHNGDSIYPLDGTLSYEHARGTPLIELVEFSTAADGSFFFAVPERHGRAGQAVLETPGEGRKWQAAIRPGKETDMGVLDVGGNT